MQRPFNANSTECEYGQDEPSRAVKDGINEQRQNRVDQSMAACYVDSAGAQPKVGTPKGRQKRGASLYMNAGDESSHPRINRYLEKLALERTQKLSVRRSHGMR